MNFSGKTGALDETYKISGACCKCFRTKAQAKTFIEDWKDLYADVVRQAVRKGLDEELRPGDMSLNVAGLLLESVQGESSEEESLAERLRTKFSP
jgi:hypothetical protein